MLAFLTSFSIISRSVLLLLVACLFATVSFVSHVDAEEKQPAKSAVKTLKLPWMEEPLQLHQPIKKRTPEQQTEIDATAWYMTGQLLQGRNDFRGAYAAYKKAIQLDPKSIAIYRALIPLAFSLNQKEEAARYATQAIKIDPDDYRLLQQLGIFMFSSRRVPEATKLLVQAVKSKRLDKFSIAYILIQRDLAIIYRLTKDNKRAADAYATIFNALEHPEKYHLNSRAKLIFNADSRTSYQTMGEVFFDDKRYDLAVKAFEQAAKSPRGKPGLLGYHLARVYHATAKPKQAETEIQKYFDAKLSSKGKAAYELFAKILESLTQQKTLLVKVERLAKADSQNVPLKYFLAEQYLNNNRLKDAEKLYRESVLLAKNGEGYLGLAKVYRLQKQPQKLLLALEKITLSTTDTTQLTQEILLISKQKDLVTPMVALGEKWSTGDEPQLNFTQSYLLAKITAEAELTDPTIKFYRFALKARPAQATTIYDELGGYLLISLKYDEAAKVFQEAIDTPAISGAKPNFLYRISQAYGYGGKTKEALKAIREARKLIPTVALLHYQEALILYRGKRNDEAIKMFEEVIATYPRSQAILRRCRSSLSNLYVQQGNLKKGEEILEKVYKETPDDPGVNNDLGYLYADHGKNLKKAESMIRKALKSEPENAAYLDSMGWVLYKLEKYQEALTHLKKAVKKPTGGDSTIWEHLGDVHIKLNQKKEATAAYKKALEDVKKSKPVDQKRIKEIEVKLK